MQLPAHRIIWSLESQGCASLRVLEFHRWMIPYLNFYENHLLMTLWFMVKDENSSFVILISLCDVGKTISVVGVIHGQEQKKGFARW